VAIMQIPWALYWINQPPGTLGTPVGGSLASIAKGEQAPRIAISALALGRALVVPCRRSRPGWRW
jgi:hypothetical protein